MLPLALVAIVLAGCRGEAGAGDARADSAAGALAQGSAPVAAVTLGPDDVVRALARPITEGIAVSGSLNPAEQVEIKAQLAGQLGRVLVERGTVVRRGQTLVTYDAGALRAQAASVQATLAARERDLRAADTLFKRGAASEQDFVQARVARDAAAAQVTQARETLSRATIVAPIGGQVSEKVASSGEAVQAGNKLFTIVNNDVLEMAGQVGPDQIGRVRAGQTVQLSLDAYPGRVLTGRVDRLDPVADPSTRQVTVYIRVDNRTDRVVAGLFASGAIQSSAATAASSAAVAVPLAAVREENGTTVVYAVEQNQIRRRVVTLGARDTEAGVVEIREGIAVGTLVMVSPGEPPRDGTTVRLAAPATAQAGTDTVRTATAGGR